MKKMLGGVLVLLSTLLIANGAPATASVSPELPAGFSDSLVATIASPTAIAFTPDGRILVTQQSGQLRIVKNGSLLPTPAMDIAAKICADTERGLLGVTVDSDFATNHYVFVYYTFKNTGSCPFGSATSPVNRVARFTLGDNDLIDTATEKVLIDNVPSVGGNHNGGDVHIGKDGYLYISIGDSGCDYAGGGCAGDNDASRDQQVLLGKILRIKRNGGIPADNPFLGPNSDRCYKGATVAGHTCQETFAWGLRNPFRFALDPNASGTVFRINDVGQDTWEEIDAGLAGADYGWNVREGHCAEASTTDCGAPPPGMTNPIFDYLHANGCGAITGGAFVPNGIWPVKYDDAYLFSDLNCGKIFRLVPDGLGGFTTRTFTTGIASPVDMQFGPFGTTQALYYTAYSGELRRITFDR